MTDAIKRREFLAAATAAAAGAGLAGCAQTPLAGPTPASTQATDAAPPRAPGQRSMRGLTFDTRGRARIAIVGTGLRGRAVLAELLTIEGAEITAIADLRPANAALALEDIKAAKRPAPAVYTGGERDFERLVQRDDIDLVYTATPWEWHVPVCLAALNAGKHAATECPAGATLEDLWALVDAAERNRRHCLQLENCNYGYTEMLVNRLVHAGVLGELLHCEAAYLHDLREILFETRDEGLWRRGWHTRMDANLYPTHGLGPVARYLDIHRGDRFDYLVSMSSPEAGLSAWRDTKLAANDPRRAERYLAGDVNTSLIKTARGRSITLQHGVSSPRPYSRLNGVQGSKGIFQDYPPRIYVEGQPGEETFGPLDPWQATHEDPLWRELGERAREQGGHGGMDFVMCWRLVQCLREGLTPDFDVYDAAAWSAPLPLSRISVAGGSAPVKFPDFTRGEWQGPNGT